MTTSSQEPESTSDGLEATKAPAHERRPPRVVGARTPMVGGDGSGGGLPVTPLTYADSSGPEQRAESQRLQPGMRVIDAPEVDRARGARPSYIKVMTMQSIDRRPAGVPLAADRGGFVQGEGGVLQAGNLAAEPQGGLPALYGRFKRLVVGQKIASSESDHQRLSKVKALAVFSSDALSSSAYATEEILIVLAATGAANLSISLPIAFAILALLAIVAVSYRQTIHAYPNGGGAYIVSRENLGEGPGLVAAAALLVDYILTVSVSVAAGIAAITSALPDLGTHRVLLGVIAIAIVTTLNLRGVRESGTIFAIPTYAFIFGALVLLITGVVRILTGHTPQAPAEETIAVSQGLGIFLILRAFSSGCAALTGVEAISNGVPAFKKPEPRNASITLVWMAVVLGTLFMGITLLAHQLELQPSEHETIVSQLGRSVFGENPIYYAWQAATALILLLAANTAFADFPRLASLLARDNYMPHQFSFRGDRLAFSNGIMALGLASAAILAGFKGEVTRLIPLYAVGVFVSFTLSQAGMVRHWLRYPEAGWRRSIVINGLGAVATMVVAVIIVLTKFTHGAWMTMLIGTILFLMFRAIRRHYDAVAESLRLHDDELPARPENVYQAVLVPVRDLNRASLRALNYARSISRNVTALHVTDDPNSAQLLREDWERYAAGVSLVIIESPYRSFTQPILSYLDAIDDANPNTLVTVVLPEFVPRHWWQTLLHGQDALRLKGALLFREGTVVTDVPSHFLSRPRRAPRQ